MSRRSYLRRRDVLLGGTAFGAFALLGQGCGRPHELAGLLDDVAPRSFPLGAASGDVTHEAAVLWTRYLGDGLLDLELSLDHHGVTEQVLAQALEPGPGGFVHTDVRGLLAGATYRYAFRERGTDSQVVEGRFRVAPQGASGERLIFSASACSKNGKNFGTLASLAQGPEVDLHVLLGDTVYADAADTLEEYRGKWEENLSTAAYRRLRQTRSVLGTWDDHEVSNDWSGDEMTLHKRVNGVAAFFEHTPLRRFVEAPDRIWRSFRWGTTAEFFMMDGRSERRSETRGTPEAEYISRAQMDWLKQALARSPAHFKVLVNSVPIGAFPGPFAGWTNDQWVGYAAQREELLSFLENEVRGAFFLSGDFHMASLNRVSMSGPGSRTLEVLTGASATSSPNPFTRVCSAPQFAFATTAVNVATFHLDPSRNEVAVRWSGLDGQTLSERSFRPL